MDFEHLKKEMHRLVDNGYLKSFPTPGNQRNYDGIAVTDEALPFLRELNVVRTITVNDPMLDFGRNTHLYHQDEFVDALVNAAGNDQNCGIIWDIYRHDIKVKPGEISYDTLSEKLQHYVQHGKVKAIASRANEAEIDHIAMDQDAFDYYKSINIGPPMRFTQAGYPLGDTSYVFTKDEFIGELWLRAPTKRLGEANRLLNEAEKILPTKPEIPRHQLATDEAVLYKPEKNKGII